MSNGPILTSIPRNIRALYVDLASTSVLQPDAWVQGSGYGEMANGIDLWVARSFGATMQARAYIYIVDHAIDALGQKNQNNGWAFPFALLYAKPQQSWYVIEGKARDAIVYGIKDIEVFAKKNKFEFSIVPITSGRGAKVMDIAVKIKGPKFVSLTKLGIADMSLFAGLPTDAYEPPTTDNGIHELLSAVDSPFTLPVLRQVVSYRESISSYLNAEKKEFGRTLPGFYSDDLEALWFFRGAMLPVLMLRRGASASSLPSTAPTSGGDLSRFGARVPFQIPPRVSPRAQAGVDHAFEQGYEYALNVLIQNNGVLNGWKRR